MKTSPQSKPKQLHMFPLNPEQVTYMERCKRLCCKAIRITPEMLKPEYMVSIPKHLIHGICETSFTDSKGETYQCFVQRGTVLALRRDYTTSYRQLLKAKQRVIVWAPDWVFSSMTADRGHCVLAIIATEQNEIMFAVIPVSELMPCPVLGITNAQLDYFERELVHEAHVRQVNEPHSFWLPDDRK